MTDPDLVKIIAELKSHYDQAGKIIEKLLPFYIRTIEEYILTGSFRLMLENLAYKGYKTYDMQMNHTSYFDKKRFWEALVAISKKDYPDFPWISIEPYEITDPREMTFTRIDDMIQNNICFSLTKLSTYRPSWWRFADATYLEVVDIQGITADDFFQKFCLPARHELN